MSFKPHSNTIRSAADVKMEIPCSFRSIAEIKHLELNQYPAGYCTFWEVVSAAIKPTRSKTGMVTQGHTKFGPRVHPKSHQHKPKINSGFFQRGNIQQLYLIIFPNCSINKEQNIRPFRQLLLSFLSLFYRF